MDSNLKALQYTPLPLLLAILQWSPEVTNLFSIIDTNVIKREKKELLHGSD